MDYKLEVVVVPVSDVDRAKIFYGEQCGFNVDLDTRERWHARRPADAAGIGLLSHDRHRDHDLAAGLVSGPAARCHGHRGGMRRAHRAGVDVGPIRHFENGQWLDGKGGPWNSFASFDDPDGNGWLLQETPNR